MTDDSVTTNHPIKLHMILSRLTERKRKEQRARRKLPVKMARGEKENVNGPKDERRKQNNNVSPFQY